MAVLTTSTMFLYALVLLIDERPEEVTDFHCSVKAEVIASSNDQDLQTMSGFWSCSSSKRRRRMVESGKDVLLMDSLTRIARAYNSVHGGKRRNAPLPAAWTRRAGVSCSRRSPLNRKRRVYNTELNEGSKATIKKKKRIAPFGLELNKAESKLVQSSQ